MLNFFPGQKYGGVAGERLDCASPFKAPLLPETGADPDGDGGGSTLPEDGADDGEPVIQDDPPPATEPAREESLEDLLADDEDDDTDDSGGQRQDPRYSKLAKKNRKMRRQLAKALPLVKRLEGLNLDDLITSQRQLELLQQQA